MYQGHDWIASRKGFVYRFCMGPYHEEHRSTALLEEYIAENGLTNLVGKEHKHHEIYLSDPNRTAPEKLKTVIRFPVSR